MTQRFRLGFLLILLIPFINAFNVPNAFATGNKDSGELVEIGGDRKYTSNAAARILLRSCSYREPEERTMTGPI